VAQSCAQVDLTERLVVYASSETHAPKRVCVQVALSAAILPEAIWQGSTGDVAPCSKVTAHCISVRCLNLLPQIYHAHCWQKQPLCTNFMSPLLPRRIVEYVGSACTLTNSYAELTKLLCRAWRCCKGPVNQIALRSRSLLRTRHCPTIPHPFPNRNRAPSFVAGLYSSLGRPRNFGRRPQQGGLAKVRLLSCHSGD
jgi:hypothetical protein